MKNALVKNALVKNALVIMALVLPAEAFACEPEDVFCEEPAAVEPQVEDDWSSSFIGLDDYERAEERAKKKKKRKKTVAQNKRPTPSAPQP